VKKLNQIKDIKVVEYSEKYASSIADMWNKSSSNWGGSDTFYTGEEIVDEHKNNDHINTYLAIDNNQVIGYCSFNEYKEDEGALYIPLLNVRPDYHGKKVGKKLVKVCVERAIELNWPRLDLYTWPGNIKAVPLYKKCGFFWEKRDDSTHLMNFLPTVLNTEAVKDYFEEIDWYVDSIREIEVVPDGSEEDDFNTYQYKWKTKSHSLTMKFDRRGRGIRMIETDDYLIESILPEYKLPFENKYKIIYYIKNKTANDLNVSIKGINDKNIGFKMEESFSVEDEVNITGEFYLDRIEEEQDIFRTHPAVTSEIEINGKKAVFRNGVLPKYPVKCKLNIPYGEILTNTESICFLDLENGYEESVTCSFVIPGNEDIKFLNNEFYVEMKPNERKSIPIRFILNNYNFFSEKMNMSIALKKKKIEYQTSIQASFNGPGSKYGGEREKDWIICNGTYQLKLSKSNNSVSLSNYNTKEDRVFFLFPRIGLPYTTEFSRKRAEEVEFIEEEQAMLMKAHYLPQNNKTVELFAYLRLYSNGVLESYYEVYNIGESETEAISIARGIYFSLLKAVLPYDGTIIELNSSENIELESWDLKLLSENWMFNSIEGTSSGICWSPSAKLTFNEWHFLLEESLGIISPYSFKSTEAIYLTIDTYDTWVDLRSFALDTFGLNSKPLDSDEASVTVAEDTIRVKINEGNPFVVDDFTIKVKRYKKADISGEITISSINENINKYISITEADSSREVELDIPFNYNKDVYSESNIDLINLDINLEAIVLNKKKPVFFVNPNSKIKKELLSNQEGDIYSIKNGDLEYYASKNYAPTLYSLTYKGEQWLDSLYPEVGPRSWWNPWSGGILTHPDDLKNVTIQEAEREIEFAELADNKGNLWHGICINMKYKNHEKYNGLTIKQYYLSLPDLPLLLITNQIIQNTGNYFDGIKFVTEAFFKPSSNLKKSWLKNYKSNGESIIYKAGINGYDIFAQDTLILGATDSENKIQVYQTGDDPMWGVINTDVIGVFIENRISLADGDSVYTPSTILMINDDEIETSLLKDLKNIRF